MRVRSKGLGRIELHFDLSKAKVDRQNPQLVLSGKTERPVVWDFAISIEENDMGSLFKLMFRKASIGFFFHFLWREISSIFRIRRKSGLVSAPASAKTADIRGVLGSTASSRVMQAIDSISDGQVVEVILSDNSTKVALISTLTGAGHEVIVSLDNPPDTFVYVRKKARLLEGKSTIPKPS